MSLKSLSFLPRVCTLREWEKIRNDGRGFCNAHDRDFQTYGDDDPRGVYDDGRVHVCGDGLRDVYDPHDACGHAYGRVPRDAYGPHDDDDARDDHDDAYGRGRAYDLLYGDDHAYGTRDDDAYGLHGENDDGPDDDHGDVPPYDRACVRVRVCGDGLRDGDACDARDGRGDALHGGHAYVRGRVSDDGLRDDDAYDPRDGRVYGHVRVCDDGPHGGRDDALRGDRACARVRDDAYVPPYGHACGALCDRVHGDDDVSQFLYDYDDDDAR